MNHPEEISLDESTPVNRVDDAWRQAKLVLARKGIKNPTDGLVGVATVAVLSPAELRRVVKVETTTEKVETTTDGGVRQGVIKKATDDLNRELFLTNGRERMRAGYVGAILGAVAISTMNRVTGHYGYENALNVGVYGAMIGSTTAYVGRGILGVIRAGVDRQGLAKGTVNNVGRYASNDTPSKGTESKGL